MVKVIGWVLVLVGLFGSSCLFWGVVFDGAVESWQGRAWQGTFAFGLLFVAVLGGAVLASNEEAGE